MNFDLAANVAKRGDIPLLAIPDEPATVFLVGIIQEERAVVLGLASAAFAGNTIPSFRRGAVPLISLFLDAVEAESDRIRQHFLSAAIEG